MYFIDELNGGNVYKYTSAASFASVKNGAADYFAASAPRTCRFRPPVEWTTSM
jgi:hypothetical protein